MLPATEVDNLQLRKLGCPASSILFREEYGLTFDILSKHPAMSGGMVITSTSGIGKSVFIFYALLQLLSTRQPVALQFFGHFVLFHQKGVEMHDAEVSTWGSHFEGQFWALSDSIEKCGTPCQLFMVLSRMGQAWIVQTTSLAADRWKRWCKECHAGLFIMKSFNERESKALSTIFNYDVKAFLNFHRKWGGCALTCIDLVERITSEGALQDKASKLAKNFAKDPGAITMEKSTDIASHYLFTLSPHEDDRAISIFQVATPYLRDLVMKEIAQLDAAQQASFYFQASDHSHLQGVLGYLFERYFYLWLFLDANAGNGLSCTAVQSGKDKSTTSEPGLLSLLPVGKDNVTVSNTSFFREVNNKRAAPFAWIPDSRTQPTFDAIIFTHDHIITIQATVADNHSINPKGFETMKAFLSDDFQNTRKLCHVFITDCSTNVTGLRRHRYKVAEDMGISVYVAHLDISMFTFTSDELERTNRVDDEVIAMDMDRMEYPE